MTVRAVCLTVLLSGALVAPAVAKAPPPETAARLQAMIVAHAKSTPNVPGEALYVSTPGWTWEGATGAADAAGTPLTPRYVFRVASVTKTYTAAAILRLMEQGRLGLADPIARHISPESAAILRGGGYDPAAITVQNLLAHTSGIYDYAMDPKFGEAAFANPARQWTRAEQIRWAMDNGKPYGKPGEVYGYSDTGYVLLGEIIERTTGKSLAAATRELLRFHKLGLKATYWEQLEPAPKAASRFAGNWFGTTDLTKANPSMDLYGGGGLVSDTREMAVFFRALLRGEVFDKRSTLAVMMTVPPLDKPKAGQRPHNNATHLVKFGGQLCQGHGGFWGQMAVYCPEKDVAFGWTINQAETEAGTTQVFANSLAAALGL